VKKGILCSIVALVLGLGLALAMLPGLVRPVGAATPGWTGNAEADFTGPGILIIPDPDGQNINVTLPLAPPGTISGWDMADLRLTYNSTTDTLYVGINFYGIAGDADGDGNPSAGSYFAPGTGSDNPDLSGTECISVYFDLDQDGDWDVIAGVPGGAGVKNITAFTVAYYLTKSMFGPPYSAELTANKGSYCANPSAAAPDFEFTILNFSTLPGQDALLAGFRVHAFAGSLDDGVIGEDDLEYEQDPATNVSIVSSASKVLYNHTVTLNVTEYNSGSVNLTNPQVVVTQDGGVLLTLASPPDSGDASDPGVLNVGETWHWNNRSSNPITGTTTFNATGSAIAPGDFLVTYPGDPGERDDVTVNTMGPDTITSITPSATKVYSGGSVNLTVTEENTGDDPLTNPYVLVNPGGYNLTKASPYYYSGDTNGDGILDTTETWRWTNIPSGPITTATTFVALGFGTDSLGHEVSYDEGYSGERDDVTVNVKTMPHPVGWETYLINKLRVLLPWIALLAAIMVGAGLLVLRRRRT
jgi:hypothetical protein